MTCGGFIQFQFPEYLSKEDIGDNLWPNDKALEKIIAKAENYANFVLTKFLCKKRGKFTVYITLG